MFIEKILPLDGSAIAVENKFGSKIHILSILASKSVAIPPGFCISYESMNDLYNCKLDEESLGRLREPFNSLLKNSKSGKTIVRSSMSVEDKPEHQFPGIFNSYSDVCTFDQLEESIFNCVKSKESNKAHAYAGHFGIKFSEISVSVFVQEQIIPIYSGLAHLEYPFSKDKQAKIDYLELIKGPMPDLIQGKVTPSIFHLESYDKRKSAKIVKLEESGGVHLKDIETFTKDLEIAFNSIREVMKSGCVVEFAINENGLKVLQARPHNVKGSDPIRPIPPDIPRPREKRGIVLKNEKNIGLKGAAMQLFHELNLFKEPVLFFSSDTPLYEIEEKIKNFEFGDKGITVRYSKGDEIGLPRIFASTKETGIKNIFHTLKHNDYFTIVHSYMEVARSFELLVDNDFLILEHIPGLWEADNTLEPDVIFLEGSEATILRVKEKRQKIISTPYSTKRIFENPEDLEMLKKWCQKVNQICNKIIRPKFKENLPLNFHFIEAIDGKWNFLNIRRMVRLSKRYVRGGSFFYVRNINDLAGWDGKTSILLKLSVARGEEKNLVELAEALPKGNIEVYICFGYLSHPAIMMREFGINIVPAYFNREIHSYKISE